MYCAYCKGADAPLQPDTTLRTFRASTGEVALGYTYTYDANHSSSNRSRGQLTGVKLLNGSGGTPLWQKSLTYNSLGLLAAETVNFAAAPQAYTTQYGYDSYHRPVTTRYPDGETLTLSYNSRGLPQTLTTSTGNATLVDAARYDPSGRLTSMGFPAGGLQRTQTYHAWKGGSNNSNGRLASILVGTAADDDNRLKLTYGYDSFGNIRTLKEGYNNGSLTQNDFTYDAQNRLTNAFGQNYRYDDAGRMTHYEGASRTVNGSFPVHAVKGIDYAYDGNGNLVKRGSQTLSWDPGNRLAGVIGDGVNESYLYDDGGIRVQKTSDGVITFYPFAHYEVSAGVVTKYYRFGGKLISMREGGTLTYLHNDHLGSVALTTSGSTVNQQYYAYGKKRGGGTLPTEYNFTGQKRDESGLVYMNARYYDPQLGTFISPDTAVPYPTLVTGYNKYLYSRANPLMWSDPTGHCEESIGDDDAECWYWLDRVLNHPNLPPGVIVYDEASQWSAAQLKEKFEYWNENDYEAMNPDGILIGVGFQGSIETPLGFSGSIRVSVDAVHIYDSNESDILVSFGPSIDFSGQALYNVIKRPYTMWQRGLENMESGDFFGPSASPSIYLGDIHDANSPLDLTGGTTIQDKAIGYGVWGMTWGRTQSTDGATNVNYVGWAGSSGPNVSTGKAGVKTWSVEKTVQDVFNSVVDYLNGD